MLILVGRVWWRMRVEKQIKLEVGADCCTEPNGIGGPWGATTPSVCVFTLFSVKMNCIALSYRGLHTGWVCVCVCVWKRGETQSLNTKNTNTHGYMNISSSRWLNTETCNCYFHHAHYHTAICAGESSAQRKPGQEQQERKREHFLRVRLRKETVVIFS